MEEKFQYRGKPSQEDTQPIFSGLRESSNTAAKRHIRFFVQTLPAMQNPYSLMEEIRKNYLGDSVEFNGKPVSEASRSRRWKLDVLPNKDSTLTVLALFSKENPVCAAVVLGNDLFVAYRNFGAYKNGQPLNGNLGDLNKVREHVSVSNVHPLFTQGK